MTDKISVLVTGGKGCVGSYSVLALVDASRPIAAIGNPRLASDDGRVLDTIITNMDMNRPLYGCRNGYGFGNNLEGGGQQNHPGSTSTPSH